MNSGFTQSDREARCPSGRASDSGARGRGFDPHSGRLIVSLSKIYSLPKTTGNTRKRWLRPDMTETMFTGRLSKNETKTKTQSDKPSLCAHVTLLVVS